MMMKQTKTAYRLLLVILWLFVSLVLWASGVLLLMTVLDSSICVPRFLFEFNRHNDRDISDLAMGLSALVAMLLAGGVMWLAAKKKWLILSLCWLFLTGGFVLLLFLLWVEVIYATFPQIPPFFYKNQGKMMTPPDWGIVLIWIVSMGLASWLVYRLAKWEKIKWK